MKYLLKNIADNHNIKNANMFYIDFKNMFTKDEFVSVLKLSLAYYNLFSELHYDTDRPNEIELVQYDANGRKATVNYDLPSPITYLDVIREIEDKYNFCNQ